MYMSFLFLLSSVIVATPEANSGRVIEPCVEVDPAFQAAADEFALGKLDSSLTDNEIMEKCQSLVDRALISVGNSEQEYLRHWLRYLSCQSQRGLDDATMWRIFRMRTIVDINDATVIEAVIPMLGSGDRTIEGWSVELLLEVEGNAEGGPISRSMIYVPYVKSLIVDNPGSAKKLLRYMFATNPGPALIALLTLDRDLATMRKILDVGDTEAGIFSKREEPIVPGGRLEVLLYLEMQDRWKSDTFEAELERLSRSKKWWIRLWTAEFIRQVPRLGSQQLRDELSNDPDPVVRERIELIP